ncbi:MAG: efflux transporter outer membrane subunit [Steroidobacteraceae bacterium]
MLLRVVTAVCVQGCLTGCMTVGPNFTTPPPPTVTTFTRAAMPVTTASAPGAFGGAQRLRAAQRAPRDWWRAFGSAKLDALVDRALRDSPTLIAAEATLSQARQLYAAQSGATRYPTAAVQLGLSREEINGASIGQPHVPQNTYTLYNAATAVNYQFDLFGGNRRALEVLAAQADYEAYEFAGARLTLAANVVTTAFRQAQYAAQIDATRAILADQQRELKIACRGVAIGTAAPADVLALRTQLEETRASLPPLRDKQQQANHLLAVLVGQPPGASDVPSFTLAEFALPAQIPLLEPARLVRQRPDVRAAIALLHAATAQYGVAISALYPRINLSAGLGTAALTGDALFGPSSILWDLASNLAQPVFNAGLKSGARAAHANMQAVGANYQQTVLQALRNVADALRQLDNDAEALQRLSTAYATSRQSLELLRGQYRIGSASYVQLLISEQQTQQIRMDLVAARAAKLADSAALYQAMGGEALPRAR